MFHGDTFIKMFIVFTLYYRVFKCCFLKRFFWAKKLHLHTKPSSFIPVYILKVFTEDVVHTSFMAWFIEHFVPSISGYMNKNFKPGFIQSSDFCSEKVWKLVHFNYNYLTTHCHICILKDNIPENLQYKKCLRW